MGLASGRMGGAAPWNVTDPDVLRAAGEASIGFPNALERSLAPQLPGLAERLEAKGAAFLDVGVGVGALAIAMAKRWPHLRILGVDPFAPALSLAREAVTTESLSDRIELRLQGAEELMDRACFDLAWVPSLFISGTVLPCVLERVVASLRPGGWVLLPIGASGPDPLVASLARLRTAAWGGAQLGSDVALTLLMTSGLEQCRILPTPPNATVAMAAGRRSPERSGEADGDTV